MENASSNLLIIQNALSTVMDTETPNHLDEDPEYTNYQEFATLSVLEKTPTDEMLLLDHEQKFKSRLRDYSFVDNFFIRKIREFYGKDQILASKFNQKFRSKQWKNLDKGYMKIRNEKIAEREEGWKKKGERQESKTTSNDKTITEKSSASGSDQEFKAQPNDYSFIETRLFRKAFEWCDERHIRRSDKIQTHGSEEHKKRDREKMEKRKAKIDGFRVKDAEHKERK